MHDDAERAVVGIGVDGVGVRHLGDGQQGQKGYADQNDRRKSARLCGAMVAEARLECGKQEPSS